MQINLKVNDILHGFTLVSRSNIDELHAEALTFSHVKTGARLFFLNADDDNKVFYIGFRTPPTERGAQRRSRFPPASAAPDL